MIRIQPAESFSQQGNFFSQQGNSSNVDGFTKQSDKDMMSTVTPMNAPHIMKGNKMPLFNANNPGEKVTFNDKTLANDKIELNNNMEWAEIQGVMDVVAEEKKLASSKT